jgi:hypothetical protein
MQAGASTINIIYLGNMPRDNASNLRQDVVSIWYHNFLVPKIVFRQIGIGLHNIPNTITLTVFIRQTR